MLERLGRTRAVRTVTTYLDAQGPSYAAALAFNVLLAMFPLILGMLAIVGLVVHDATTLRDFQNAIAGAFPASARDQITGALEGVRRSAGILGIISVIGLFWTGTSIFTSMEFSLAQLFGCKQRDGLRQRLMAFVMLIVFLLALGADIVANTLVALLPAIPYAGFAIGVAVMMALLMACYRFVPNRTFGMARIWSGALVAGVLVEIFTLIFPIYARLSHGFNTYGQQFALFFVLAIWISFLCQFILAGAVFIRVGGGDPDRSGLIASPRERERKTRHTDEVVAAEAHRHPAGRPH